VRCTCGSFFIYVYSQSVSVFILNRLFKIPFRNLGAFTTTIFIYISPFLYFFMTQQNPNAINPIPRATMSIYLGIAYAIRSPAPTAIRYRPAPYRQFLQQHLFFLNIITTNPLFSVYSAMAFWLLQKNYTQKDVQFSLHALLKKNYLKINTL